MPSLSPDSGGATATRLDNRDTLVITSHPLAMLYEGWFFEVDVTGLVTGAKTDNILGFGIGPRGLGPATRSVATACRLAKPCRLGLRTPIFELGSHWKAESSAERHHETPECGGAMTHFLTPCHDELR